MELGQNNPALAHQIISYLKYIEKINALKSSYREIKKCDKTTSKRKQFICVVVEFVTKETSLRFFLLFHSKRR